MQLFHRQTQLEDLEFCSRIIEKDFPHITHTQREDLVAMWKELISNHRALSGVIENHANRSTSIIGFGMSIFVTDAFIEEIFQLESCYVIWYVVDRWRSGTLPVLTFDQIREANRGEGLNVLGLHSIWGLVGMSDAECAPIRDKMLDSLFSHHRGFNVKRFAKEMYGDVERDRHLEFGFLELRPPQGTESLPADKRPHLIGISREEALQPRYEGRMIREFFRYTAPICTFTAADQETLQLALVGLNEAQIADICNISVNSVKSRWDSIYMHIQNKLERDLFNGITEDRLKSRALLHWLQKHPQELRPSRFHPGLDLMGDYARQPVKAY